MTKAAALLIPLLVLGTAVAATAGDAEEKKPKKKKCSAEVTVCVREMASHLKQRGWIGIDWKRTDGRPKISHVVAGSPAEKAGVKVGDVVVAFAGVSTDEAEEVMWAAMKRSLVPDKVITLAVVRDGAALDLQVELIAVPDHIIAQWVGQHVIENHTAPPEGEATKSP